MTAIVQAPSPGRTTQNSAIGALLAALMLGAILAVAPVSIPATAEIEPASADTRQICTSTSVWVPQTWVPPRVVPGQGTRARTIPGYWIPAGYQTQTTCVDIAHSHWWSAPLNFAVGAACGLVALRVLGWYGGVGECPVGFACVERWPGPVVVRVGGPEAGVFGVFGEVVGCLGGGVGEPGVVPVRGLGAPAPDGASGAVGLRWQKRVTELRGWLIGSRFALCGVSGVVYAARCFFSGAGRRGPRCGGRRRRAGPAAWSRRQR